MSSPPRDGIVLSNTSVLSSSPVSIRGGSPSRRRSTSPSELSDVTSRPPRHSPTLVRSYDPNDPQVRERQRTMDVDMARQFALARRETLPQVSPVVGVSPYETMHSAPEHTFPSMAALSPHEERELDHARDASMDIERIDEDTLMPNRQGSIANLQPHLHQTHDPSLLVTLGQAGAQIQDSEDPSSSTFGLPTYQANVSRTNFDFTRMEEFARVEKTNLGMSSPVATRFVLPRTAPLNRRESHPKSPPLSDLMPPPQSDDGPSDPSSSSPRPQRHRKISQSNTNPRTHRKGVGGKMALFETNTGESSSSLPARLGLALGTQNMLVGPSYDNIAGVPSTAGLSTGGILNTGHDRPYRFSFYSNALSATIHARSLSELPAEGQSFEDLFSGINPHPAPPKQDRGKDRPTSSLAFSPPPDISHHPSPAPANGRTLNIDPNASYFAGTNANRNSIIVDKKPPPGINGIGDSDTNTWWLDIQSPTDEEMKMLSKVFSIHPLTTEDILMEETREKIELFRNYYLVCFRSFDQDPYSPTHLEPLNMYIIVFREGTLSFHFRPTPHPQNVRRRIKQLKDYISVTSDWISYALIDDITDAFGPLIQSIEYEVDSIDELVLILKEAEQSDMLRRIGTCRKKVMGLLRLMGNKADVVKGLAKRCNENWRVAPTSDIGLYLSDIQDHLITMTQNLNHYEKILSRSHSNYLAQISIEMTDANNQINDVLSKLTALGTVLIPMNLVTGLWGMNVHVPGEGTDGYAWFISIVACLAAFAAVGGYSTYKFMVRQ
ncbi:hypothetical protein BDQ12DRAFT_702795 [Crucibulum laeve]|uniref:Cora-domain-containing protein n=1 Tax=Crucibulum laeve TaxID=68775 RepID=A0A5C3MEF9_9AGAR|nr:hypothetical protein BDQ12DRAFT_702795 [Crucibulum laeve]